MAPLLNQKHFTITTIAITDCDEYTPHPCFVKGNKANCKQII